MKRFIQRYPLEFVFFAAIIYALFFTSAWTGKRIGQKFIYLLVSGGIIAFLAMFETGWTLFYLKYKQKILSSISSGNFYSKNLQNRILISLLWAVSIVLFVFLLDTLVVAIVFGGKNLLAGGIPYPIFSFVVNRVLIWGVLLDLVIFTSLLMLLEYILKDNLNKA